MTENVKNATDDAPEYNRILGIINSLILAILGMGLATYLFLENYEKYIAAELEICPVGCEHIITWFMPAYTDMEVIGGLLALFAAYGFYRREKWAAKLMMVGNVLILKFSFWPLIPAMDVGIFPEWLFLFFPATLLFVVNAWLVAKVSWGRILTSMLLGMAAVTSFMSGTAATNMYMKTMAKIDKADIDGLPTAELWDQIELYMLVQRLGWLSGLMMLAACYMILFAPQQRVRMVVIAAALIVLIYEVPLAWLITEIKGEFSMMFYGPIIIVIFLPIFLHPSLWKKFVNPIDG